VSCLNDCATIEGYAILLLESSSGNIRSESWPNHSSDGVQKCMWHDYEMLWLEWCSALTTECEPVVRTQSHHRHDKVLGLGRQQVRHLVQHGLDPVDRLQQVGALKRRPTNEHCVQDGAEREYVCCKSVPRAAGNLPATMTSMTSSSTLLSTYNSSWSQCVMLWLNLKALTMVTLAVHSASLRDRAAHAQSLFAEPLLCHTHPQNVSFSTFCGHFQPNTASCKLWGCL